MNSPAASMDRDWWEIPFPPELWQQRRSQMDSQQDDVSNLAAKADPEHNEVPQDNYEAENKDVAGVTTTLCAQIVSMTHDAHDARQTLSNGYPTGTHEKHTDITDTRSS